MVFLALFFSAIAGAIFYLYTAPQANGQTAEIVVSQGAGLRAIAQNLEDQGMIKRAGAFCLLAKIKGLGGRIRAGEYEIIIGTPPDKILELITGGKSKQHRVTIPEGYTLGQIARELEKTGIGKAEEVAALFVDQEFISSLGLDVKSIEGYCFPETYSYTRLTTPKQMIKRMVDQFFKVYDQEQKRGQANTVMTRDEIVILASICEREARIQNELPKIARVYLNRLAMGMPLQADPTVIYGITDFSPPLTKVHLKTPGPYNTYLNKGLTPGPICNPGRMALRGAMNPAESKDLYFVAQADGSHYFSTTYSEHQKAVARYRAGQ